MKNKERLRLNRNNRQPTLDNDLVAIDHNVNLDVINKVNDLEDGSSVYEIGDPGQVKPKDDKFHSNLAVNMKDGTLKKLAEFVLDAIDEDIEARQPWLDLHNKLKKYTGYDGEDLSGIPFSQACRTVDSTLSTAVIRFCATTVSEMLPESGPAGFKIFGQETEELEYISKVRSQWLNYYLTVKDAEYYKDYEKFIYYLGFYGTIIRKVYYDNILKMPLSRFILPENFLVNIDCSSILDSDRLTHILKLSAREVLLNQKSKTYRDVELPYLKVGGSEDDSYSSEEESETKTGNSVIDLDVYTQRSLHDVYESHIFLNLETFDDSYNSDEITEVAKPYIVTIDKESREILRIERNWKESDKEFKRRRFFVAYQYYTGFDIWGQGLARMAGNGAITVTNMLRQTIDAATYQNLPAGFIQKGTSKQQVTDITLGAGQWKFLDASGDIRNMFAPLPANGPSQSLMQLRQEIIAQMQDQLSTSELGMMDSKEDIPTGTAIAFLQEKNKIQSKVHKSIHNSFSQELRLLDEIFKEVIDREEFFVNGEEYIITRDHYIDSVQLVPVSDPSVNSTIERVMKAEAVFQTAMQLPDKVNAVEAIKLIFKAQGLPQDEIESLLMQDEQREVEPRDPITENMDLMQGKPVKAGIAQNHDAHIVVHSSVDNEASAAHIQEHMALKFMLQMQNEMGIDLSQVDPNDQEMQNELALKAAEVITALGLGNNVDENKQLDPNELIKAEIEQKREESLIRKQIADDQLEADTFKTQLHFEETKQKLKLEKEKALLEAKIEMEKLRSKFGGF
jgi:hypothetical protein